MQGMGAWAAGQRSGHARARRARARAHEGEPEAGVAASVQEGDDWARGRRAMPPAPPPCGGREVVRARGARALRAVALGERERASVGTGETHGLTAQGGGSIVVAGRELAVVTAVLLLHLRGALKQSDTYHIMLAKHS
jgi:hypothetical protein